MKRIKPYVGQPFGELWMWALMLLWVSLPLLFLLFMKGLQALLVWLSA